MSEFRHIHLDAVGGAAGDMFAAAMLDALPDLVPRVMADLATVLPPTCGTPLLSAGTSGGLPALRFGLADPRPLDDNPTGNGFEPPATGGFRDIRALIERAELSSGTAGHALAILGILAEAEGRVHQVAPEDVHFHEIADWDSIMDVVAAGSIAAALGGAVWSVSPLPLGGGLVRTRHGLLPVPAPATVELLKGFSWRDDGIGGERVTPTGAAIIAHLVVGGGPAGGRLAASGTGAGNREMQGMPNILRAMIFEGGSGPETVAVLSFDVDDMTGEEIADAAERLRAFPGVRDLSVGTRLGKKSRPSHDFRLFVAPPALVAVEAACFEETSTIGLRWRFEDRLCLPREEAMRTGEDRLLPVKRATRPGGKITTKVENDALAGIDGLARRRRLRRLAEDEDAE